MFVGSTPRPKRYKIKLKQLSCGKTSAHRILVLGPLDKRNMQKLLKVCFRLLILRHHNARFGTINCKRFQRTKFGPERYE